ncbi:hypothetical protein TWF718_001456 [Orbilia javanica]|uniref:Uncharacterized protein n=1 Tax=Orbilia javanica TaxID=47235 RepID=A0AAN8P2L3_9PEZI
MGWKDIAEFLSVAYTRVTQDEQIKTSINAFVTNTDKGLSYEDRNFLFQSRQKSKQYTQTGSMVGFWLGIGVAILRVRRRGIAFRNLQAMQGSGATVRFADGREELITNIAPAIRPSFARNAVTFGGLGLVGFMVGGMVGGSYGGKVLREYQEMHPDSVKRVKALERKVVLLALRAALESAEKLDAEWSERDNIDRSREDGGIDSWPPPDNPPPEFPRSY